MLSRGSDVDPIPFFSPFDPRGRKAVVAAVSGGSDSLAMLVTMQRWLERNAPQLRLMAATVDHGLRAESRAEAEAVARICAARGIPHRIISWTGEKPEKGLPAAARLARYALLAQVAASAGTDIVATGHTADDQAETLAMRQRRGGGRGLAGMAPATLFEGKVWIIRPLLGARREILRQYLREQGIGWIDDPTNLDTDYERVRTRRALQSTGADGEVEALLRLAALAGAERIELNRRAAALIEAHAERPIDGLVRLATALAREEDEHAAVLALRALLAVIGGVEHLPDAGRVAALFARLREGPGRWTLSRTVIDARNTGIFLYRELRGVPASPATAGEVWDGRYEIVAGYGASAHAEGAEASEISPDIPMVPPNVPRGLIRAVRATMPQFDRKRLEAFPVLAPWRQFLPCFDLPLARSLARLMGAADILPPPFAGHNGKEA